MRYTSGPTVYFDCSGLSETDYFFKATVPALKDGGNIEKQSVKLDLCRMLLQGTPSYLNIRFLLDVLIHSNLTGLFMRLWA